MNKGILKILDKLESQSMQGLFVIATDDKGNRKKYEYLKLYDMIMKPAEDIKPPKFVKMEFVGDYPKAGVLESILLWLADIDDLL